MSPEIELLRSTSPSIKLPVIISAPMRTVSGLPLTMAVSNAGGLGFYGAGYDLEPLVETLAHARKLYGLPAYTAPNNPPPKPEEIISPTGNLPIGFGIIIWNTKVDLVLRAVMTGRPCAVWLFAPSDAENLDDFTSAIKENAPWVKIFIQIGSVAELERLLTGRAGSMVDVIVAQGVADSGGHGRTRGASVIGLVPEFVDVIEGLKEQGKVSKDRVLPVIAAGGIVDGRGVAAALALGAHGVALGTKFIATSESDAPEGFKQYLLNTKDGGQNTIRIYDTLRGTGNWPQEYNGRAVVNDTFKAYEKGLDETTNRDLYEKAIREDNWERLTMFAGTGVGLIKSIEPAAAITESIRLQAVEVLKERVGEYWSE